MSERNETLDDIEADLRERAENVKRHGDEHPTSGEAIGNLLLSIADRIKAAVTRERIQRDKVSFRCGDCAKFGFDCDAGDVDGNEDCLACENFVRGDHLRDAAKMVGNAAALRQALERFADVPDEDLCELEKHAREMQDHCVYGGGALEGIILRVRIAKDALASPPRNCNRFANIPGDAICAWLKEDPATRYMTNEEQNAAAVFARWLFSVAAQEGGKA